MFRRPDCLVSKFQPTLQKVVQRGCRKSGRPHTTSLAVFIPVVMPMTLTAAGPLGSLHNV